MSYLGPLRLHFSGSFQAAISTVNNDPVHFDNATFEPSYQEPQTDQALNGWFSPRGSGDWRLFGCLVTSAFMPDGLPVPASDPIAAAIVADSDRAAPAKLVDLDSEQQLVSMIWGLEVRIATLAGETMVRGKFEPVAFVDIWDRGQGAGPPGDFTAGATYQSVLTDVEWSSSAAASPFLVQLKEAVGSSGMLSIKFNVDGINLDPASPHFLIGRIVGTIGPAAAGEPRHFVAGRQFMTAGAPNPNFFIPVGNINFCAAAVDRADSRIYLDLGNAMPTTEPGGPLANIGDLALCYPDPATGGSLVLGSLPAATYTAASWYSTTAGIVAFPADRPLTADEMTGISARPLSVVATTAGGTPALAIAEHDTGVFARADQFVFRLNPGEDALVHVYATRFGQPYPGAAVITVPVPEQLQPVSYVGDAPPVATPADAVGYPTRIITDDHGIATLRITTKDPGRPRDYIDGQVYAVCPVLEETIFTPTDPYPFNQWNYVSLLLWSGFQPDEPLTWFGTIQPILQQYANLYPVMRRFLDLGSYESVCENARLLSLAFGLDESDPNSMPATRDLSAAKRAVILRWLAERGADGLPRQGTAPPGAAGAKLAEATAAPASRLDASRAAPPSQGGKASAVSRRLVAQRPSVARGIASAVRGQQS